MKIKYTVYEKQCPHCHHTLEEDWREAFSALSGCIWFIAFPVLISNWLIRRFGFGDPDIPKVGDKVITCPNCSLPIRTDKVAIEELNAQELLIYSFRAWFIVGYVLGGICILSALLAIGLPWCSLIAILSLLGVVAIITTYRIKLREVK